MVRFLGVVLMSIALSSCAQTVVDNSTRDIPPPSAPYAITAEDVTAIEAGVRSGLKDPASATFGPSMKAMLRTDGMVTVCGYVNAKNSYGGYVGMQPFMGLLTIKPVRYFGMTGMGGTDTDTTVIVLMCRKAGIEI